MSDTTWYVEPLDSRTNTSIAGLLAVGEEETLRVVVDGRTRLLWRLGDYRQLALLEGSRGDLDLWFNIFNRKGNGKIRDVTNVIRSPLHRRCRPRVLAPRSVAAA